MKPTRRQELKTNELAETLAQLKEWFRVYGNYVMGGAVVVLLIVAGGSYYVRSQRAQHEKEWSEYRKIDQEFMEAMSDPQRRGVPDAQARAKVEELLPRMRELASSSGDAALASQAWRWIGDLRLRQALGLGDPKDNAAALEQAEQAYRQAISADPEGGIEVLSAKFGLAAALESMSKFDQAQQTYKEIADAKSRETKILSKLAAEKIEQLGRISAPVVFATSQPTTLPTTRAAGTRPADSQPATRPTAATRPAATTRPTVTAKPTTAPSK
jgi:tetratricopeptide (TPR) repeat protein